MSGAFAAAATPEGARLVRERTIVAHLPLVVAIARRYAHRGESFEDLVQVGSLALIRAVDRFDPGRGAALAAFAAPTIEGEIRHHLRDTAGPLRTPRRLQELARRLEPVRRELATASGRPPTDADVARAADCALEDVLAARSAVAARVPLPLGEADVEVADPGLRATEERLGLVRAFASLGPRERRLVELTVVEGLSQEAAGRRLGLSQAHVSRLLGAAIGKLRAALEEDGL